MKTTYFDRQHRMLRLLILPIIVLIAHSSSSIAQDEPFIIWVYDVNTMDSEFGYYNGTESTLVNGFHEGADIEGLACIDNVFYGSSGHNTVAPSELITIELDLATNQSICHPIAVIQSSDNVPFYEVASLAVDEGGALWGFAEDVDLTGIIRINPSTAEAELIKPSSHKVEGIAWLDGTLWLVGDNNFYTWQPGGEITPAFTLDEDVEIEALDAVDGLLYAGIHKDNRGIMAIDPITGIVMQTAAFPAPSDIEGLAFCPQPAEPTPVLTLTTVPPAETPTSTDTPRPTSTQTPTSTVTSMPTTTPMPTATTTSTPIPTPMPTPTPPPTAVDEPSGSSPEEQPSHPIEAECQLFMPIILK